MDWSPVFKGLEGDLKDGELVNLNIDAGQGIQKFPQTITWVVGQRFGWKGASPYGDFLQDNHVFYFVKIDENKTLFIQSDQSTCTDPIKMKLTDSTSVETLKGLASYYFMGFNLGLKKMAEGIDNFEQPELVVEILDENRSPNSLSIFSPYRAIYHAEIIIDAPVEKVWEVVTDFDKYNEWSSTYQNLIGDKENGNTVSLVVKGAERNLEFPMSLRWVEGQRFGWGGGNHSYDNHMFMVIPYGNNQTLFIQTDDLTNTDKSKTNFTEENTLAFLKMVAENNFVAFNKELKEQVEKHYSSK